MNMRRIAMVLVMCMLVTLLPATAAAADEASDPLKTPFQSGNMQLGAFQGTGSPEQTTLDGFQSNLWGEDLEDGDSLFGDGMPNIYVGGVKMEFGKVLCSNGTELEDALPESGGFAQLGVVNAGVGYVPALLLSDYVYEGPGYDITSGGAISVTGGGIYCGIYSDWTLYILLAGENRITRTCTDGAVYGNAIGVGSQVGNKLASMVICDYSGDGSLIATDNGDCAQSYGIYCNGYVNILDGTVTAQGGATKAKTEEDSDIERHSYGIYGSKGVYISGGTVNATGGNSVANQGEGNYYSAGILVDSSVPIDYSSERLQISGDAVVTAAGGQVKGKGGLSAGLFSEERFLVIGGNAEVRATGGDADGDGASARSYGIGSGTMGGSGTVAGVVAITDNAKVEAKGGDVQGSNSRSTGIYCRSTVNGVMLSSGTVTAEGGVSASGKSFGIDAASGSAISGGTVIAKCDGSTPGYSAFVNEDLNLSAYNGGDYWWRTNSVGYTNRNYIWAPGQTYVEIRPDLPPVTTRSSRSTAGQAETTVPVTGDDGSLNAGATVKDGTAQLSIAPKDLTDISGDVNIDLGELDEDVTGATLGGEAFGKLVENADSLSVQLTDSRVTLDAAALTAVSEQAGGADVTVSVTEYDKSGLDEDMLALIGDQPVYELSLSAGGKEIHDFGGGKVTVSLPYTLKEGEDPENIVIWRMVDGVPQPIPCQYNAAAGMVTFETGSFSLYVVAHFPFADVPMDSWYYGDVAYVYQNGLMKGVSDTSFAPEVRVDRAMLVTTLHRLEGEPVSNYAMDFPDVDEDAWYGEAVRWAAGEGIVNGYSDGRFGPADPLTREQMAAILYRYEQYKGGGFVGAWMFLLDYEDRDQVSDWAYEPLCWCSMNGIIEGSDGKLLPAAPSTRAQMAAVLNRFTNL